MKLSDTDKLSPVWVAMKKYLEERVESMRCKLENEALTESQTAALRGRLAELRGILALEKTQGSN